MANKTNFFVVSLIAMMAVAPAVADTPATQEWTKNRYDSAMRTINQRLATDVRDKIYQYDANKQSDTYGQVLDPLNTEAETAFSGINEVLEKVDGNDGTSNSAVTLETTAQNAFGAINELKGEIDNINVPTKISDLTDDSDFLTSTDLAGYATTADLADYATTSAMNTALAGKQATISDLETIRSGAAAGATALQQADLAGYATTAAMNTALEDYTTTADLNTALAGKQATISDLETIRSGAAAGATAVQPAALNDYATTTAMNTALADKADDSDLTALETLVGTGTMTVGGSQPATVIAAINALDTKTNGIATEGNLQTLESSVTALSNTMGSATLDTTAQTVTGAINELNTAVDGKQDAISDIATIRSGAAAGATAVQPAALADYAQTADLAEVATSGDYDDLTNKPTLATVATSGSYADLTNKPTIPTVDNALNAQSSNAIANSAVASKLVASSPEQGQYVLGYVNGTPTYIAIVDAE